MLKSEEGDRLSHSNSSGSRICNVDRIRIFFFCAVSAVLFFAGFSGEKTQHVESEMLLPAGFWDFLAALPSTAAGCLAHVLRQELAGDEDRS